MKTYSILPLDTMSSTPTVLSINFSGLFINHQSRQRESNPRQAVYKTATLPLSYVGLQDSPLLTSQDRSIHMGRHNSILYSIVVVLTSPTLFSGSGSQTLGAIVHNCIPMLLVSRRQLPWSFDLEFDFVGVAAWSGIVVVVERNHAIVRFRVDRKPCQY